MPGAPGRTGELLSAVAETGAVGLGRTLGSVSGPDHAATKIDRLAAELSWPVAGRLPHFAAGHNMAK